MKIKLLLLSAALGLGMSYSQAQLQVAIFGGYQFSSAGMRLGTNEPVTGTTEVVRGSLGRGIDLGFSGRYYFRNNLGIRIDAAYNWGTAYKSQNIITGSLTEFSEIYGNQLTIAPMLTFRAPVENWNFYAFAGPMIGSCRAVETNTQSGTGAASGKEVFEYTGNTAFGWKGGIGANRAINEHLGVFLELHINSMSYAPKQAENTEAYSGAPKVGTVTFVDSRTAADPASNQLQQWLPFSSLGLNIGLSYSFDTDNSK